MKTTTPKLVPAARLGGKPQARLRIGTMRTPPPMPKKADRNPVRKPEKSRKGREGKDPKEGGPRFGIPVFTALLHLEDRSETKIRR